MTGVHDHPQLAVGTQVVLRDELTDPAGDRVQRGTTGRVSQVVGEQAYLVTLLDEREVVAERGQLSIRRVHQHDLAVTAGLSPVDGARLVEDHTVYAAVVGSRAFGLSTEESDTDTRGVYVAPTSSFWSLVKPPPHVEGPGEEWFSWEVERFCELALKANPNLLEVLHSPLVVRCTDVGRELVDLRPAFLSQLVYQTYSGYVLSQFKKIEADFRKRGVPKWKHVMHLLRLLISAGALVRTGALDLDAGENRDRLLSVRRGETSWAEAEQWRRRLQGELDVALEKSPLPAAPDAVRVDAWLQSVRRRSLQAEEERR